MQQATRSFGFRFELGGVLVAMMLVLTACMGDRPDTSPSREGDAWGPLAVVHPSDAGDGALIEGELDLAGDCVLLDERGDDVLLIWPADRVGWDAEAETVTFESNRGEVVTLEDGDRVTFGGGGSSLEEGGQSGEEFVDGLEWVSRPAADCVTDTRWFVYDIVP